MKVRVSLFGFKLSQQAGEAKKNTFLEGFCPISSCFCLFTDNLNIYEKDILKKKSDPACFFWPQGKLIQSSAAPQRVIIIVITIMFLCKVTMKSLEETIKEQGGEEFLAMVKEVNKEKWMKMETILPSMEDLLYLLLIIV